MTDDPSAALNGKLAAARAKLLSAIDEISTADMALSAVERAIAPSAPAWTPASEFRGEPGGLITVWLKRTGQNEYCTTLHLNAAGTLRDLDGGLVCPIPPPPPLPDAPPALTPPGVWVRAEDFRGEAESVTHAWHDYGGEPELLAFMTDEGGRLPCVTGHVMRVDITRPAPPVTP